MPVRSPEILTIAPVPKKSKLNRAARRAEARLALFHRKRFCSARCDECGDYIPFYYFTTPINPKWRAEVRRLRKLQQRGQCDTCSIPKNSKRLIRCYDCHSARMAERIQMSQAWEAGHRHHPLDRLIRLFRWNGVEVDEAACWARYHATKSNKLQAMDMELEIAETLTRILGQVDHSQDTTHPFAAAMAEMRVLGLQAPLPEPDDDATEAVCALEVSVFRLTGETGLRLNDQGWKVLHRSVLHCLWKRELAYKQDAISS